MFLTPVMYVLEKAMDAATLRHKAISHNIANVNTPGYKRYNVSFEEKLNEALGMELGIPLYRTHPNHLPSSGFEITPEIVKDNRTSMRSDGNNVDVDREMVDLVQNTINYNIAVQMLNNRLAMLRYIINEGRR